MALEYYVWFMYPRVFLNLLWFPALWFFTRSQLDKSFRFSARHLWHTIPAFISLISLVLYFAPLSVEQIETERAALVAGNENLPMLINDVFGFAQFFGYFAAIFFYVRKQKKYLHNNYSNSGISNIQWIVKFLTVHFVFFLIALLIFAVFPRTDSWVCPIVTVLIMTYLVYVVIYYSPTLYLSRLPDAPAQTATLPVMTTEQMKEICDTVMLYLQTTCAYKNSDFTLSALSHETGIHYKSISAALNTYLKKNFFEIVNAMRIEEAKRRLQSINTNHIIESIATECGFRSRSTFFATFKKMEGISPKQWLKMSN
jgi:AraC-like DNA-binding protein